jgi:hypothetical protein
MRWTTCQSGYEKKKKRQRLEAAAQSQKGALDRFVVKESRINSENQTPDANVDDGRGDNVEEIKDIAELDERNDDSTHNKGNDQPDDEGSDANAQERLSGLATTALESEILEKINYNDMIEDFISRNTQQMLLFGRS